MPRFSVGPSTILKSFPRSTFIVFCLILSASGALCFPVTYLSAQQAPGAVVASTSIDSTKSNQINRTRLRFSWGGGSARQWTGEFQLGELSIGETALLGLSPDTPGSIFKSESGIAVEQLSATSYAGFDIEISGSMDSVIQFELFPIDQPELKQLHQISLRDVFQSSVTIPLDEQNNRLSVARAPGDLIPVDLDREHLIFETGQQFQFDLRANWTALAAGPANCKLSLLPARSSSGAIEIWTSNIPIDIDETGSSRSQQVSIDIPRTKVFTICRSRSSSSRPSATFLGRRKRQASRTIQFVAIDPTLEQAESNSERLATDLSEEEMRLP